MGAGGEGVVVGLSGGVDSSVAALLLQRQGYQVWGATLEIPGADPDHLERARRIAGHLELELQILPAAEALHRYVMEPFARSYAAGETPNPCALCNPTVKWPALCGEADRLGAPWVATGHYARVERGPHRSVRLRRGLEPRREQSYFLARLPSALLERTLLPLGELTKPEVEALARREGLPTVDQASSMEICFARPGRHPELVAELLGVERPGPGDIIDLQGRVLGRHPGVHHFTIGQRRGLGIGAPHPLYVVAKDAPRRCIVVGPEAALNRRRLFLRDLRWIHPEPPELPLACQVKIRYRTPALPAEARWEGDQVSLLLEEPVRGVAPGQAGVLYRGDEVLGAGWISSEGED